MTDHIQSVPSSAIGESTGPLDYVPNGLLSDIVQQALQRTKATGAAIALGEPGNMVCLATAGECPSKIGATIDTESGLTGLCVSSGVMQTCMNAELDERVDGSACREVGIGAMIVLPLFYEDRLSGLVEVFSRRPYAFGMRDMQALQGLEEKFAAGLRHSSESARVDNDRAKVPKLTRIPSLYARFRRIGLGVLVVIASFLIGVRWGWKPADLLADSPRGRVFLLSTVPDIPPHTGVSQVVEGVLVHRADPTYPMDALRQRIQGQVVLMARIGKDGSVYDAKPIRGNAILSKPALDAVRQWRFSPYRMNDKPFDVTAQITFDFSIVK